MSKVGEDKDHQGAMISPEWRRFSVSGPLDMPLQK